jgi:hypothetical protein
VTPCSMKRDPGAGTRERNSSMPRMSSHSTSSSPHSQ